jgi:hypothetical protein
MSYTRSKSQVALGVIVAIGPRADAVGTPVFVPIFELKQNNRTGQKFGTEMVTNFNSGGVEEKVKTLLDPGQWAISGNRVSSDAGQIALHAAFLDSTGLYLFQITYDKRPDQVTTADVEAFAALVTSFDTTSGVGKTTTIATTLDISGLPTFTEGA